MSTEPENAAAEPAPKKKGRLGIVLAIVAVVLLVAGAAVAGTLLGPKLLGGGKADAHAPPAGEQKAADEGTGSKIGDTTELNPILVDTRGADGALHHLKVVLAIELAEGTPKDEFMKYSARGREAAVAYLRSQPFETVAAPERYDAVRTELGERFAEATGKKRIARVLVVDFVAQ